jgi:serine/threonine protein kinase
MIKIFNLIKDVFGHKSNVSLVFDFMDTDMEVLIKDTSLVLTPANVKAYTLMTLKGLEYLHTNWILHRVENYIISPLSLIAILIFFH